MFSVNELENLTVSISREIRRQPVECKTCKETMQYEPEIFFKSAGRFLILNPMELGEGAVHQIPRKVSLTKSQEIWNFALHSCVGTDSE
jgi:hypothetical protein